MSTRIFIGSPVIDHGGELLRACDQVKAHSPEWRIVQPDSWHVTYAFPGNVSDEKLQEAKDVTRLLSQEFKPHAMEADRLMWMPERSPNMLWLSLKSTPAFEALFHAFHKELGIRPKHSPNPHVTIMRGNATKLRSTKLPELSISALHQYFAGINLYQSFLQPGGSRYEVLRADVLG